MHSSGGYLTRQESVRQSYTTCIYDDDEHNGEGSDNRHIKFIVKLSKAGRPLNPHKFNTLADSFTVGENGDILDSFAW